MTLWTVEERAWQQDLPDLPDDVIALLATPVVVSAARQPDELGATAGPRQHTLAPKFLPPAPAPASVHKPRRSGRG